MASVNNGNGQFEPIPKNQNFT